MARETAGRPKEDEKGGGGNGGEGEASKEEVGDAMAARQRQHVKAEQGWGKGTTVCGQWLWSGSVRVPVQICVCARTCASGIGGICWYRLKLQTLTNMLRRSVIGLCIAVERLTLYLWKWCGFKFAKLDE